MPKTAEAATAWKSIRGTCDVIVRRYAALKGDDPQNYFDAVQRRELVSA